MFVGFFALKTPIISLNENNTEYNLGLEKYMKTRGQVKSKKVKKKFKSVW